MNYMQLVKQIEKVVSLSKKSNKTIAIYPYGMNGLFADLILSNTFGVDDYLVVDNYRCKDNQRIKSFGSVGAVEDYIWLITSEDNTLSSELIAGIIKKSNSAIIEQVYPDKGEDNTKDNIEELTYDSSFKLISQIGTEEAGAWSTPCNEFLQLVRKKKAEGQTVNVAEIGIGIGATAVAICKELEPCDSYYCFDIEDKIDDLLNDLKQITDIKCKLIGKPNTTKLWDSYNWALSDMVYEMRNEGKDGLFDVAYLDGAHTFLHDGLAACLLKELVKTGGYLIFDDMNWNYMDSFLRFKSDLATDRIFMEERFTEEQAKDYQVRRVVNMFMINDKNFDYVPFSFEAKPWRTVYRRIK